MSTKNERSEILEQLQSINFGTVVLRSNDDKSWVEAPVDASFLFMRVVENSFNDEGVELSGYHSRWFEDVN